MARDRANPILERLLQYDRNPAVSLMMPTHRPGHEIRQDPIRFDNLIEAAAERLNGMRAAGRNALLARARKLVRDRDFWAQRSQGLAVFLGDDFLETIRVPFRLEEELVIGRRFYLAPILPILTENLHFRILTISRHRARLLDANFQSIDEIPANLPRGVEEIVQQTDYQLTHHARRAVPGSRGTGGPALHSFGDDPDAVRKAELVEYLHRINDAVGPLVTDQRPLILCAQPQLQGAFRTVAHLRCLLSEGLSDNPDALTDAELHRLALELMSPRFDAVWVEAKARFDQLAGEGTGRALTDPIEIVEAARYGRIDTLFLARGGHLWGEIEERPESLSVRLADAPRGEELLDYAAAQTLRQGGAVKLLPKNEVPRHATMAAILRFAA